MRSLSLRVLLINFDLRLRAYVMLLASKHLQATLSDSLTNQFGFLVRAFLHSFLFENSAVFQRVVFGLG